MGYRKRTPEGDAKFFTVLETGAPVSVALAASGYSRTAVYHWRKRYARFAAAWSHANANAVERLEAEADARLRARYFAVCHRGAPVGTWTESARGLLRSRLRALRLRGVAPSDQRSKGAQ